MIAESSSVVKRCTPSDLIVMTCTLSADNLSSITCVMIFTANSRACFKLISYEIRSELTFRVHSKNHFLPFCILLAAEAERLQNRRQWPLHRIVNKYQKDQHEIYKLKSKNSLH